MKSIIFSFIFVFIFVLLGIYCIFLCGHKKHSKYADFIVSFDEFKSSYAAAPKKYIIDWSHTIYEHNFKRYLIGFSFSDWFKYMLWIDKVYDENKKSKQAKCKDEYIALSKLDSVQNKETNGGFECPVEK